MANSRCVSCGAKIEDVKRSLSRQEELERRYQQEGFSVSWFAVSLTIMAVMTAALVVGLPMVVPVFDFEGSAGMLVSIPVWFVGGLLIGLISPGKTFIEAGGGGVPRRDPDRALSLCEPDREDDARLHVRADERARRPLHADRLVHRRARADGARPKPPGMRKVLLLVALLLTGCPGDRSDKSEAAAIDRAIDALRDAPNDQKGGALAAAPGAAVRPGRDLRGAQSACVVGYELYVSGITELERTKKLAASGDGGPELGAALSSAQATLERAKPLTERCTDAQGELARKYRL